MKEIIVSKTGNIKTIKEALEICQFENDITIRVQEGIYHEKITIKNDNVIFIGENRKKVILDFDDYAFKIHEDGRDYNTFRTATCSILGNNCSMQNLTIRNTSVAKTCGQAIALEVYGNYFKANNIDIISEQDTLFLGPLQDDLKERYSTFLEKNKLFIEGNLYSKFKNCTIEGNVDFIFGTSSALFYNCSFVSNGKGYVFAPSHSLFQEIGFNAIECKFIAKNKDINDVYIARPWRRYGKINILNCKFAKHIKKEGYIKWNNPHPEIFNRFYEYPLKEKRISWINTYSKDEFTKLLKKLTDIFTF